MDIVEFEGTFRNKIIVKKASIEAITDEGEDSNGCKVWLSSGLSFSVKKSYEEMSKILKDY